MQYLPHSFCIYRFLELPDGQVLQEVSAPCRGSRHTQLRKEQREEGGGGGGGEEVEEVGGGRERENRIES